MKTTETITGSLYNVGCKTNKDKRPTIYLGKFYPRLEGQSEYKYIDNIEYLETVENNRKLLLEAFKQGVTFAHSDFSDVAYNRFRSWYSQNVNDDETFYKWVIVTPNGLATDFNNKIMYFDSFEFDGAKDVLKSIRKTFKY